MGVHHDLSPLRPLVRPGAQVASVLRFIPGGFEGSHIGHPLHALLCKAMGVFSEVFRRRLCCGHVSFDIVFYLVWSAPLGPDRLRLLI